MNALGCSKLVRGALAAVVLVGFVPNPAIALFEMLPALLPRVCTGRFVGQRPTKEQLQEVLKLHAEWLALQSEEARLKNVGKRANLCRARLSTEDLDKADLRMADL